MDLILLSYPNTVYLREFIHIQSTSWYEKQVLIQYIDLKKKTDVWKIILILRWQYLFSILVSDWDALFAKTYE